MWPGAPRRSERVREGASRIERDAEVGAEADTGTGTGTERQRKREHERMCVCMHAQRCKNTRRVSLQVRMARYLGVYLNVYARYLGVYARYLSVYVDGRIVAKL